MYDFPDYNILVYQRAGARVRGVAGNLAVIFVRMYDPTFQNPHIHILGSENRDPFIFYLQFKNTTYTNTSMMHRIASRKE